MKLDNKGWGLSTMLICVGIIFIALLTAAFFTLRLNTFLKNNGSNKNTNKVVNSVGNTTYYAEKIADITSATNEYITNENIILTNNEYQKITLATLIYYHYIDVITDKKTGNLCEGYALANKDTNNIKNIKVYLNCDNYETEGYGEE